MNEKTRKRLSSVLYDAEKILRDTSKETGCTDAENDVLAELANLKNALENFGITPEEKDEIRTPLSNGGNLVAYCNRTDDYPGAGVVYENPEGDQYDLVLIENEGEDERYTPKEIRVFVYADAYDEDYTDKFIVRRDAYPKG